MLIKEIEAAKKHIPGAIGQAYSLVVTVNENNDIHAFKVVVTDAPLFTTIKADPRARIQETAISSEAMMPGGPYDLWREEEDSRRVKDLVGAFAQFPKLPKMLRQKEILDTVVQGVQQGIWVARIVRPDRTARTFWRTAIDEAGPQGLRSGGAATRSGHSKRPRARSTRISKTPRAVVGCGDQRPRRVRLFFWQPHRERTQRGLRRGDQHPEVRTSGRRDRDFHKPSNRD